MTNNPQPADPAATIKLAINWAGIHCSDDTAERRRVAALTAPAYMDQADEALESIAQAEREKVSKSTPLELQDSPQAQGTCASSVTAENGNASLPCNTQPTASELAYYTELACGKGETESLLPCPFCGSTPDFRIAGRNGMACSCTCAK